MGLISRSEGAGLLWLAKEAKIDDRLLMAVLMAIRSGEVLYSKVSIPKSSGGTRTISIPSPHLRIVQRAINKKVLSGLNAHSCAFGFSGGSIVDTITPHLESGVMLSFDIADAFDQISRKDVFNNLTDGRKGRFIRNLTELDSYGYFSWYTANMVTDICTWRNKLPQGAPTSPRLFDQAFKEIDSQLSVLAQKVSGVFTRYADNIFFSLKGKDFFPPKLERAVLRVIDKRYFWHERSVRSMDKGAVRILGLNVIDGKITAPRDYKRRMRLTEHHIRYLLDHGLPFESAWVKLQGQMAFGGLGILPDSLLNTYANLEERIEEYEV